MATLPQRIAKLAPIVREGAYDERDTILYALAVGLGRGPGEDAAFVDERQLRVLPTQACVMAWDDSWVERLGLDRSRILHAAMAVELHAVMPVEARVRSRTFVESAIDKGANRGAIVFVRTELECLKSGDRLATLRSTAWARGEGGFGGEAARPPVVHAPPDRGADLNIEVEVRPEQAALYRLCGDRNPLHIDPLAARSAGFERPILHGLCTWGMAAGQIVRAQLGGDAHRLHSFQARFVAPVYPGDRLLIEAWIDGEQVGFRTSAAGRGLVLDDGRAVCVPSADDA